MITHGTVSGHEGDEEDDRKPPNDVIGSGQKTATGHAESGLDPRIETGLPENESARAESGSDPKIATARGRTATKRMTDSDALDREREEERERGRRPRSRELSDRERALRSFLVPRPEDRGTREDRARERSSETSLDSSRRGACCDERGEATEEAARAGGVSRERATSPSPAPEGAEETEARSRAMDERPDPPPLSIDRGRAGGEEAPRDNTRCTLRHTPPLLILPT